MKRGLLFVVGIVLALMAIFLFFPGAKTKRVAQVDKAIQKLIAGSGSRKLTQQEIDLVKNGKSFRFLAKSQTKAPDIYLFMPSLNVNIALLARTQGYPSLEGYQVNVFPLAEPESLTSERALGMCLLNDGPSRILDFRGMVALGGPTASGTNKDWSKLTDDQRKQIVAFQKENQGLLEKLSGLKVIVIKNGYGYGLSDWKTAADIYGELTQLD